MWTSNTPGPMIDIHMHLIPGVDDGACDEMMALSMIVRARDQGIGQIFATPHSSAYDHSQEKVWNRLETLDEKVASFFPGMRLYAGCEVYCDEFSMEDTLEKLRTGVYPTMNGTEYVLMEFSMWILPDSALRCVEAVAAEGWKPIIAHMERYAYLRGNLELVDAFRALGARIQINAYSLEREADTQIRTFARELVLQRKADFLGTDAHRTYHRPPSAAEGLRWLYENTDKDYADALAAGNARWLLMDQKGNAK